MTRSLLQKQKNGHELDVVPVRLCGKGARRSGSALRILQRIQGLHPVAHTFVYPTLHTVYGITAPLTVWGTRSDRDPICRSSVVHWK